MFLTCAAKLANAFDRLVPSAFSGDPEKFRRGRLIVRFGLLGAAFGLAFSLFYLAVEHRWGALIVVASSAAVALTPWILRKSESVEIAGNFHAFVLTVGFVGLCMVEGGVEGHAIAWLVSVPLCALLLASQRSALVWCLICFLGALAIIVLDLQGFRAPILYPMRFHGVISAAGYLALILFMFTLGWIFESGRANAFRQMTDAMAKLSSANTELRHLNAEKDEFMGMAAHDLKNPLTAIMGYGDMMMSGNPQATPQVQKCATQIVAAATRMHSLITNLLDLNEFEEGKVRFKLQRCQAAKMIRECIEQCEILATKKQIVIKCEAIDTNLIVRADPQALMQVLENLLSNAVKYSFLGTSVRVRAFLEGSSATFEIEDNGPGISEEDQTRLFTKFTRLTAQPTAGESSTGLGLSIVKKVVEGMGGVAGCRSTLGNGTTFFVTLPVCE